MGMTRAAVATITERATPEATAAGDDVRPERDVVWVEPSWSK